MWMPAAGHGLGKQLLSCPLHTDFPLAFHGSFKVQVNSESSKSVRILLQRRPPSQNYHLGKMTYIPCQGAFFPKHQAQVWKWN